MATAYVAGIATEIPNRYGTPLIDVNTTEELAAEIAVRAATAGAQEQMAANEKSINALTAATGRIIALEQMQEAMRGDVNALGELNISSADVAGDARKDAAKALKEVGSIPKVDLESAHRLANSVQDYGLRTINQAATSLEQITALSAETVYQVESLKSEVEDVSGTATATVQAIEAAANEINSSLQSDVSSLLADTPEQVRAAVEARLGEVEILTGGRVKGNGERERFIWEWTFAKLNDPETITKVVESPLLPGWTGAPGRSQAPVGGGGSGGAGGTGGDWVIDQALPASVEVQLGQVDSTPGSIKSRPISGASALLKLHIQSGLIQDRWVGVNVDCAGAMALAGGEAFTASAELEGPDGAALNYTFRIVRNTTQDQLSVFMTTSESCRVTGRVVQSGSYS